MHPRSLVTSLIAAALLAGSGTLAPVPAVAVSSHNSSGAGSEPSSLPSVTSGPRPGPAILYAKPAKAPQLENRGIWHAPPTLVSGSEAYRDGEWMYQDYLYDDHGALGTLDPNTPYSESDFLFSTVGGTYTYPTAKIYHDNAADLVEFRTKPLANATAFRVTSTRCPTRSWSASRSHWAPPTTAPTAPGQMAPECAARRRTSSRSTATSRL